MGDRNKSNEFMISIHAPREGSDHWMWKPTPPTKEFLSTLPARGATDFREQHQQHRQISIHAPREGSDATNDVVSKEIANISIHAPREGSDLEGRISKRPR